MNPKDKTDIRLKRQRAHSLTSWHQMPEDHPDMTDVREETAVDCGWGRLLFAQTFRDNNRLAETLSEEGRDKRDIAIYVRDPHVFTAIAPHSVFLDPSHTYRLWLERYHTSQQRPRGFHIRLLSSLEDAAAMHDLYLRRHMMPPEPEFIWSHRKSRTLTYLVAMDTQNGNLLGAVTGVDHHEAFNDPELGSSLWALAVDAQATYPGIGKALVRQLAEHYQARGRAFMDLSVMHDNKQAIQLYEKLGFERVPVFALKCKNRFNEPLFVGEPPEKQLNPYAQIIIKEARRRGIGVEILDVDSAYFELTYGGRSVTCRESLSELTTAIAMSRCDDKAVTHRILSQAGLRVPKQAIADARAHAFLKKHGAVAVKPARGEQGAGISVDIRDPSSLDQAIRMAREVNDTVLLEEYVKGRDLRIIVIGYEVVAAAVRKPPVIIGTGRDTIGELIEKLSRRRSAATGGESRIVVDSETHRCVEAGGYTLGDTLPYGESLVVRKTANLHTGGTIHDVTAKLHPNLRRAAVDAAKAIGIPVTGLDFLVPRVDGPNYVIIEANERPGLANHEPQPTAECFIDLLFPQSGPKAKDA